VVAELVAAGLTDVGVGPDAALETAGSGHARTRIEFESDSRVGINGDSTVQDYRFVLVSVVETYATPAAVDAALDALEVIYRETLDGNAVVGAIAAAVFWESSGERTIEVADARLRGRSECVFVASYYVVESDLETAT